MSSDPHTHSTPTPSTLRQWHRARSRSRPRAPSSSSLSSTDQSYPSTPQETVFPPLPSQSVQRTWQGEQDSRQKHRNISPSSNDRPQGFTRLLQDEDEDYLESPRVRTQTVTPATILNSRLDYTMRIPFPNPNQRDSASSTDSQARPDTASMYDDEFAVMPTRHPLRNRINSKGNSFQRPDVDSASPVKPQRGRAYTHRPESTHSSSSTQSITSRNSTSLRIKPKKTHSQRGAMSIFKSLASTPQPTPEFENIEFDWAQERRGELERRAKLLEQEYHEERMAVEAQRQGDEGDAKPTTLLRPRSWELTPQELVLRRELEEEERKRFSLKDNVWVNSSYVSAHPKDLVPYPVAYDKVNMQTDRHSYDLVRQIFSDRPSIHDNITHKNPVAVLDLGCGDGSWIIDAAQSWNYTLFYGLDLQNLHPSLTQLAAELGEQQAENVRFTHSNFLTDKLPYLDEKFDMVRMAHLKWAIPFDKWDFVLAEVHRVLKRGGWVEIIDDDFVLPKSPDNTLSAAQLDTFTEIETQFKDMLHARNLPLDTPSDFVTNKIGYHFSACHENGFVVAISKARPLSMDGALQVLTPSEGVTHKAAKLMGIGFEDRHLSFGSGRSRSRSRSGSTSSAASHSTRDDESVRSEVLVERETDDLTDGAKQPLFQPLGLNIHPGRFIPFSPNELAAHATRNMQSILGCKEAIRANGIKKNPELTALEVKDELLPEEKLRFELLLNEWDERRRAFDDAFWEFESAMLKRLCLPQQQFEIDDDNDFIKNPSRPQTPRNRSHRGSDVSLSSPTPSTFSLASTTTVSSTSTFSSTASTFASNTSTFSIGSSVPVRFLRVYSGWK